MSKTPNILFLGYVWPEYKSTAASQNILSYISLFLRQGWNVDFASAATQTQQSTCLNSLGVKTHEVKINCSSFDELIKRINPEIVIFDRFLTEEQFAWRVAKSLPNAIRILDCEDLHCLREARRLEYKASKAEANPHPKEHYFPKATIPNNIYDLEISKRELASIYRCDLSIVLSNEEASLLINKFSVPSSHVICIGFLDRQSTSQQTIFSKRIHFSTIGSFKHEPNWDAVLCLKSDIWPGIRRQLKTAECHVYGSYLPPKAKALENKKQGFFVHGFVENQHEMLSKTRVLLAPINFGAGIKGKLVDAIQNGTPSVTTPIGAEGICGSSDWPGAVATTHAEFVEKAIALYCDEAHWQIANQACKPLLLDYFDHEHLSIALLKKMKAISNNLQTHRHANFIGSMLLHHSMRSTQYMSQWIEAKSKN